MKRLFPLIPLAIALTLAAATTGCAKRAVAKVDGDLVTEQQFYDRLQASPQASPVLDRLILETLLEKKAKEKKVTVSPAELKEIVSAIKKQSGAQWKEMLSEQGQTEADVEQDWRDTLLITKLLFKDKDFTTYWEQNQTRFNVPGTVTYRRVILKDKAGAEKIRQEIVAGKLTFENAVSNFSLDPYAKDKGGVVGPIPEGMGEPELNQVVSTIALNEVSEPVAITYPEGAYELVKVEERKPGKKVAYKDVKPAVIQTLMRDPQNSKKIGDFLTELRTGGTITIYPPRFAGLADRYKKLKEQRPPTIPPSGATAPSGPGPTPGPAPAPEAPSSTAPQPK